MSGLKNESEALRTVSARTVPYAVWRAADRAASFAAKELGLIRPPVWWARDTTDLRFRDGDPARGAVVPNPSSPHHRFAVVVALENRGRPYRPDEIERTVLHECRHLWQAKRMGAGVFVHHAEKMEADAERYARAAYRRMHTQKR